VMTNMSQTARDLLDKVRNRNRELRGGIDLSLAEQTLLLQRTTETGASADAMERYATAMRDAATASQNVRSLPPIPDIRGC